MGLRRSLGSWDNPIENFLASPTRVDMFLQSLVTSRNINAAANAWLFPGLLPLLLAIAAVVGGCLALARPRNDSSRTRPAARPPAGADVRYRIPLAALALAVLAWVGLGMVRSLFGAGDGLSAQNYGSDKVVWTGYIAVGRSGLYNFGVDPGASSRLSIDNLVIIDHSDQRPAAPTTGSVPLSAGSHRVLLEHIRPVEHDAANLLWAGQGDAEIYRPVPVWALSRRPASYGTAIAVRVLDWARVAMAVIAFLIASWCAATWTASRRERWTAWGAPYRSNPTGFYLLLTMVCLWLALGPPYGLWQFVYWLPGFNFIRGSSRFMVLGLLGISLLAGIGFDWLSARLAARARFVAAGIICALMAAEFAAQPFSTPYRLEIPAADQWVANQPKPFVIAEVPSAGGYERYQTMYMLHSMAHWQKTVDGYGGIRPYTHSVLYQELDTFPDAQSLQHLAELNVRYVVVHLDLYPPTEWPQVDERLRAFSDRLHLEYSDPIGRVYTIRRPQETTRAY
jgi:hypothetical protein